LRKLFTLLILMMLIVTTASAQYNLLFNQPYYDGGSASNSSIIDDASGIDYQMADNFNGLTDPVEEFVFYGLTLKYDGAWVEQTPAATEPFFIRFYNYETAISEGLVATVTGTHQIELIDAYGDGWSGGLVSVFVNGIEVLSDLTLEDGPGPEYYDFEANAGDNISTVYTEGSWATENYYAILDPDGNIIAEDGGTMAAPGTSAPTGIMAGGLVIAVEPVWNSPLSSQSVTATVENVGTVWSGAYQLYKFTVTLNTPVNLATGWISAQIDANNGSGTWFLWLNSQVGDGQSWQFDGSPASRSPFSNIDLAKISNGSTREQDIYDMAFELYGGVLSTPPVCATNPFPAISATDVATDVSLSWTGDPIATGYRIYMGTDNPPTNIANGIDLGLVTSYTPAIALDYETQYFWRVVPYNAIGSATDCDRWAFTTLANPTLTPPFTQVFDTYPPINWTEATGLLEAPTVLSGASSAWSEDGFANVGTTGSARLNIYGTTRKEWMFTPPIDLGTGSVDYQLRFDLALTAYGSTGAAGTTGTDDKFAVVISTDNGATWTSANTLRLWDNAGSAFVYNDISTTGEIVIIDLTSYSGIVKIGFYGESTVSNADNDLFVDNVTVEEIPDTPIISITPASKDYGTVGVDESANQVFTISNTGGGTLVIDPAVSITGTNADQFMLTDGNTYPLNLTAGQSATVSVAFMPTSAGVKEASLVIVDNLAKGTNNIPLTGTGFERPAGSTCGNPYMVTLPLVDYIDNTEAYGNDYASAWITPSSSYLNGYDFVAQFTLAEAGYLSGNVVGASGSWLGLIIVQDCPNPTTPAARLAFAGSSTGGAIPSTLLQAGTYFAIVSTFPTPNFTDFTLNLAFEPLPDCPTPTALTAAPSAFEAVLGWTENGTASLWDIEWGASGFTQGEGTVINGVTNPYTLTGLEASTSYSYYVRADCGGETSDWSVVNTFTTQTVVPAPYVQGFATTTAPAGWNTTGWAIGSTRGVTGNPGNNIYKNLYTATPATFTIVNVGPVSTGMLLTFDYKLANYSSPYDPPADGSGNYIVSVSTDYGANYTVLETVVNNAIAGWQSKEYDLSAYNGQVVKVRIVGNRLSGDYDLAFDNFRIGLPITCFAPTDVLVTDITQATATISWTAPGSAPSAGYQWEVRDNASAVISSGTTAAGITTASVADLSASTTYNVFVRSNCGASYSDWTAPITFSTACAPIGLPWVENFDGVTIPTLPSCWLKENGDWATTNNASSTYDADARSGTQFLRESYGATNEYVWTPGFTLTAGQAYDFSFWWAGDGYDEWDGDVFVNGSQSSIGATQLGAPFVDFATETTKTYEQVTRTFTPATSGIYYFAIRVNATFGPWYLSFDDFSLMESAATKTLNLSGVRLESLFVEGTGGMMNQAYNEIGPEYAAPTADVITVELHDASNYATILRTYPGVLLSQTGTASVSGIDIPDGSYSITIKHRNSIEVTSALPVDFSGGLISYAFDTDVSCFGSNLKLIDGFYCIYAGDVNQDGQVENADASDIGNGVDTFAKGYLTIDVDGDGQLGNSDYTMYENNANNFVKKIIPIP